VWQAARMGGEGALDASSLPGFVAELAAKSDLVWVQVGDQPARPVWSVWNNDAIAVVTDGIEQLNPGLTDNGSVTVIVRSRENRARQVAVVSTVEELVPGSESWDVAVKALHPKRLNAPDGERQPGRWAEESSIWLIHPTAEVIEQPGAQPDASLRAVPMATEATTVNRTPFHAGRATKKRRR